MPKMEIIGGTLTGDAILQIRTEEQKKEERENERAKNNYFE